MQESNITRVSDQLRKPENWTEPPEPLPGSCPSCNGVIHPQFIEPVFWSGRPAFGTGRWAFPSLCSACETEKKVEAQKAKAEQEAKERSRKIQQLTATAGFSKAHEHMTLETFDPLFCIEAFARIQKGWEAGENIFIAGPPGTGKTHIAVGLLKLFIGQKAERGVFRIVPELMIELRRAIKDRRDDELLDEISSAQALVLDDLGVERPTPMVLEGLYLLIDRWYRNKKSHLVITSNNDIEQLSKHLEDRLASRIIGMCRPFKLQGEDRRLEASRA
ncbi:MAG: ATP-binding protein [Elusimicrobia bacterium]|nr:ATP-binding protein [Elusimicrobiota bacterium]